MGPDESGPICVKVGFSGWLEDLLLLGIKARGHLVLVDHVVFGMAVVRKHSIVVLIKG